MKTETVNLQPYQKHPNQLSHFYEAFQVSQRLLLTGHSHQAWPDISLDGQIKAWQDAALAVDQKWALAERKAERIRAGFSALLEDQAGLIALGQNTFELVLRFLSALNLRNRPRLVTTDSEFHTLRRLLGRLSEEGIEVVKVPARPYDTFMERLCGAITSHTAAVLCSHVFFDSGIIAGNYHDVARSCQEHGCELLVDAYHSLNVVPFSVASQGLDNAFIVGGGYKYCQLGEGCCFLRFPQNCQLRPVATGWFSEFERISDQPPMLTAYGAGEARFAGSTYDPVSHYRGAEVFDFFAREGLEKTLLHQLSRHQISLLLEAFNSLDLDPDHIRLNENVDLHRRGGFLALYSTQAALLCRQLQTRGVLTDVRGHVLRFGPAPYLSDKQLVDSMAALKEVVSAL